MDTIPSIPPELFQDIISSLKFGVPDERKALLSLALATRQLRHASQKVLFDHNDEIEKIASGERDTLIRHNQFVQAIFNHPRRLGHCVRAFVQVNLACEPTTENLRYRKLRARLWELTVKILPSLINLKSLVMVHFAKGPTTLRMLTGTQFQLEILHLRDVSPNATENLVSLALSHQRGLLHLVIDRHNFVLPDDLCPTLISVECSGAIFFEIAQMRHIKALSSPYDSPFRSKPADVEIHRAAMSRLEYLKLPWSSFTQPGDVSEESLIETPLGIKGLELSNVSLINFRDGIAFRRLPRLQVLSLRFSSRNFPHQSKRMPTARIAFRTHPSLIEVHFGNDENYLRWVYSRPKDLDEEEDVDDQAWHDLSWMYMPPPTAEEITSLDSQWERAIPAPRQWATMWWTHLVIE